MAQHGGNRNHKLAAKAARRKAVVTAKKRAGLLGSSLSGRIAEAATGPVVHCLRTPAMFEVGMGHVVLARRLPAGALGCGFFLVDVLCLGAKDVFYQELTPSDLKDYIDQLTSSGQALVDMEPQSAKRLITGAVAFATESGIAAHKDYQAVVKLFADIDGSTASEDFTFGRDGMPVYMPGPNDSPTRIRAIERTLNRTRGEQGWDFPHPSEDPAFGRLVASLRDRLPADEDDGGGLVIEHEGPAERTDAPEPE